MFTTTPGSLAKIAGEGQRPPVMETVIVTGICTAISIVGFLDYDLHQLIHNTAAAFTHFGFLVHSGLEFAAICSALFASVIIALSNHDGPPHPLPNQISTWLICGSVLSGTHLFTTNYAAFDTATNLTIRNPTEVIARFGSAITLILLLAGLHRNYRQYSRVLAAVITIILAGSCLAFMSDIWQEDTIGRRIAITAPLLLHFLAAYCVWQTYRKTPNYFTNSLVLMLVPLLLSDIQMTLIAPLNTNQVITSHFLKALAFAVPILGLMRRNADEAAAVKRIEAMFRATLDASTSGILVVNNGGSIRWANRTACQLFGYHRRELLTQPIQMLVPEEIRSQHQPYLQKFFQEWQQRPMAAAKTLEGISKNGERLPIKIELTPITLLGDPCVIAAISDQSAIQKSRDELEAKNHEIEQIVYIISHDLKSPLVTIKGFLGFLKKDIAQQAFARVDESITMIGDAADRMALLLKDLLEFSSIGYLKLAYEPLDLNQLIQKLVHTHSSLHPEVDITATTDFGTVNADPNRIQQALNNVISNAIKYAAAKDPQVTISGFEDDANLIITICDNGPGVPATYHHKIFEIFERLDSGKEGNGIGLAVVRKVMLLHGGDAYVDGRYDTGTKICLKLPRRPS